MARNIQGDPRLIRMCTECTKPDCNGSKCPEYRKLERSIAEGPQMDMKQLTVPRRSSGEKGLRLYNKTIDMLEDLKEQSDEQKQCQLESMIRALKSWRVELFEGRVNWYGMEE